MKCRGCRRGLSKVPVSTWLCRGTGYCHKCAQERLMQQERTAAAKQYLEAWRLALDTYRPITVGLKAR